jgi:hypothetical protein
MLTRPTFSAIASRRIYFSLQTRKSTTALATRGCYGEGVFERSSSGMRVALKLPLFDGVALGSLES